MKPPLLLPGRFSPFLQNRQTCFIKQLHFPKNISFFFKKKFKPEEKIEKSFKKPKTYSEKESWMKMLTKGTCENFLQRIKYTSSLKVGNEKILHEAKIEPRTLDLTTNTHEPKPCVSSGPEIPPQLNLIPPKDVKTQMMELAEQHKMESRNKQNLDASKYSSKPPYTEFVPPKREREVEVESFYPNDSHQTEQLLQLPIKYGHDDVSKSSSSIAPYNSLRNITESNMQFKVGSSAKGQNVTNIRINLPLVESGRKNLQYFTTKINNFSKSSQPLSGLIREKSSEENEIMSALSSLRNSKKLKRSIQKNTSLKKVKKVDMKRRNIRKSLKTNIPNSLENIKSSKINSMYTKSNEKYTSKLIKNVSGKKMPHYAPHTSFTALSFKHTDMNKSKESSEKKVKKWPKNVDKENKEEKYIARGKSALKDKKLNKTLQNAERQINDLNNTYSKLYFSRKNNTFSTSSEITYLQDSSPNFNLKSHLPQKQMKLSAHEILAKYSLDRITPNFQTNLSDKTNKLNSVESTKQDFISLKGYKSIQASILDIIQQRMKPAENKVADSIGSNAIVNREKLEYIKNVGTRNVIQESSHISGITNNEGQEKNRTVKTCIERTKNVKDGEIIFNESSANVKQQGHLRRMFNLDSDAKEANKYILFMLDQNKSLRTKEDMNKQDIIGSIKKESSLLESSPNLIAANNTTDVDQTHPLPNLILIGYNERNGEEDYENIITVINDEISSDQFPKVLEKYRLKDQLNGCLSILPLNFNRNMNNCIRTNNIMEGNNRLLANIYSALQTKSESKKNLIVSGVFPNIYMNNVYRGFLDENLPYFQLPDHLYKYISLKPELLYVNCLKYFHKSITSKEWNENQMQNIFHNILQNRRFPDIPVCTLLLKNNPTFQTIEYKKTHDICLPEIHERKKSLLSRSSMHQFIKRNFCTSYQKPKDKTKDDSKTHHIRSREKSKCVNKRIVTCKKLRLPGCRKTSVKCTGVLEHLPCLRKEPPQPSFSECIKLPKAPQEFSECTCFRKKKRACLSNIKEAKHYDGCTKPKKKKKIPKKDKGEECDP